MERSFSLKNAIGQIWNLNLLESFFQDVKGLGFEYSTKYTQIGNSFVPLEDTLKQKSIQGKIRFDDYPMFTSFAKFIQHQPIIMTYQSSETVFINVKVEKIGKTEKDAGGLYSDVTFVNLGLFYKILTAQNESVSGVGKRYPYTYPYSYNDNTSGTITMESDSVKEGPIKLTIIGPCTNPSWTHYLNNILQASGKIGSSENECVVPAGNRIVVDTTVIPFSIKEYDSVGAFVSDRYSYSDYSTKRFLFLGFGSNQISLSHEGTSDLNVIAEGWIPYETI